MKLLKYTLTVVLLISIAACSVNEENFPVDLEAVLNSNGAYLRVVEVNSAGFDILDLDNAEYSFVGEVFDREEGDLVEDVEFFINYRSAAEGGATIPETSEPVKVYDRSEFVRGGGRDLPRQTFTITIDEALGALGLQRSDLLIGDRFQVRWVVNLTDGRSFSVADASPVVTGGAFFNSPYLSNVFVVAAIPEDRFVGNYTFEQQEQAPAGSTIRDFASGWLFEGQQTFTKEISVDPNNTLNGRIFSAQPYVAFGIAEQVYPITIALANDPADNSVTLSSRIPVGTLGCTLGISYDAGASVDGDFDVNDDSEFIMAIEENSLSDCGRNPIDVLFTVTKN